MLLTLFSIFAGKKGPADLPYSPITAIVFCIAIMVVTLKVLSSIYVDGLTFKHYLVAIASVAIPVGGLDLLLRRKNLSSRLVQCITALYGCNIIFDAAIPIFAWFGDAGITLMLIAFVYLFYILGRIVGESLEVNTGMGVLIVIVLNLLANYISFLLLPDILPNLLQIDPQAVPNLNG